MSQDQHPEQSSEFLRERIEELEDELARVKAERDEINDSMTKSDERWRRAYGWKKELQRIGVAVLEALDEGRLVPVPDEEPCLELETLRGIVRDIYEQETRS